MRKKKRRMRMDERRRQRGPWVARLEAREEGEKEGEGEIEKGDGGRCSDERDLGE